MCIKKKKRFGTLSMVSTLFLEIILRELDGKKKVRQIGQSQLLKPGNMNASLVEVKGRMKYVSEKTEQIIVQTDVNHYL